MRPSRPDLCRRVASLQRDPDALLAELTAQLDRDAQLTFVFVSPEHDLAALGAGLRAAFSGPVVGCTTAGELGPAGYQVGGVVAMGLTSPQISAHTWALDLQDHEQIPTLADEVDALVAAMARDEQAVGILLIDGLSRAEEYTTAALYAALGDVPIIGGSAGDNLAFATTRVLHDGAFLQGYATFTLLRTSLPLTTFKYQHHEPTSTRVVVTRALPEERIVNEINGRPAAEVYAELVGLPMAELVDRVDLSSLHPVMLRLGDEYFVRSVQAINSDGSIRFYCAIDTGAVLTLGVSRDILPRIDGQLAALRDAHGGGPPAALLVFDCILRRLELQHYGIEGTVGELLARHGAVGFSTYGEQYGPLHMNQTLVGLALGGPGDE